MVLGVIRKRKARKGMLAHHRGLKSVYASSLHRLMRCRVQRGVSQEEGSQSRSRSQRASLGCPRRVLQREGDLRFLSWDGDTRVYVLVQTLVVAHGDAEEMLTRAY